MKGRAWQELGSIIRVYEILWKQYLFRHRFWLALLFLLSLAAGIWNRERPWKDEEYRGILVGVCTEDERGKALLDKLEEEEGIFRFLGFGSEEEMLRQIENGALECGYVMPEGFYDNILKGKMNRQITLYYSPASSAHKISYEVVFARLFEILSQDILEKYLGDFGLGQEENREQLFLLNEKYRGNGSTFHFVYEMVGEGEMEAPESLNPLRGCLAVMMFFMSLSGMGNVLEQERVWKGMPGTVGKRLKAGSIHIAAAGSVLAGGICLWLSGCFGSFWKEAAALFIYFVALEIFIRILGVFVRSDKVLQSLLPVLVLGSLLFCPVFIRIDRYLPGAAWIARIFPASYYLNLFFH